MKKFVSILLLSSVFCMQAMYMEIDDDGYEERPTVISVSKLSKKRNKLQEHLQGSVDALQKEKSNPAGGPALIIDFFNVDADYFNRKTNTSVAQFLADLTDKEVDAYYADYKQKSWKPVVTDNKSSNVSSFTDEELFSFSQQAEEILKRAEMARKLNYST